MGRRSAVVVYGTDVDFIGSLRQMLMVNEEIGRKVEVVVEALKFEGPYLGPYEAAGKTGASVKLRELECIIVRRRKCFRSIDFISGIV